MVCMVINVSVYSSGFLPDILLLTPSYNIGELLKKNLNAPRPSDVPTLNVPN